MLVRAPSGALKKFFETGWNLRWGWPFRWWDELYDPLSSFVPELKAPPQAGFFFVLATAAARWSAGPSVMGESGMWAARSQAVWPGSSGEGVCSRLSCVIRSVLGRPFWPRQPRRSCATSSSLGRPSSRAWRILAFSRMLCAIAALVCFDGVRSIPIIPRRLEGGQAPERNLHGFTLDA